ncbi:MAG TPA: SIR2 family protein, partial [Planctomycetota bacterium]|nr:SIR2 family protein [Planctomycetota bacterium]
MSGRLHRLREDDGAAARDGLGGASRFAAPQPPAETPEAAAVASYVRAGKCALFVGAGLSINAGLPSWNGLMRGLVDTATPWAAPPCFDGERSFAAAGDGVAGSDGAWNAPAVRALRAAFGDAAFAELCGARKGRRPSADGLRRAWEAVRADSLERGELERLLRASRHQEVGSRCRELLGRERFYAVVRDALTPRRELPKTHADIVRTPYACVVTTNFDDLLERAYERFGAGDAPPAPSSFELDRHGTLLLHGAFFILKAHGDAASPESMVFTADEYRRVIHANPAFQAVMNGILLTHALVFVGYSLSDVNFRLLLDSQLTTFRGGVPPRFAVMSGVGAAERELLWRTAKLRVLPYPEERHEEAARFLAAVADATGRPAKTAAATAPRARRAIERPTPTATLEIASDGERLDFDLSILDGGPRRRVWAGASTWKEFDRLRDAVAATQDAGFDAGRLRRDVRRAASAVAHLAPAELRRRLRTLPKDLVLELATTTATEAVPWEWMSVGGAPLALRRAVVRRPTETSHAARGRRRVN